MRAWLERWLARLEGRIVNRCDSTSVMVLVECTLPFLLLLWSMQLYAAGDPLLQRHYRASILWPGIWAQGALIAWLSLMGAVAWHLRHDRRPLNWLVQLTVLPAGWGMLLISLGHGIKDTPISMILISEFFFLRSLFPVRQLACLMVGALAMLLSNELLVQGGWLPHAPMLSEAIYRGDGMPWWWSVWSRTLYLCAALPLSGWLFFLAATLRRHRQALENVARTDMLTGLVNRREFMNTLERESHRQMRERRPAAILMFDVDHFKVINDTHGHPAGDEVLARLGGILRRSTRAHLDTAARYGGEEFVLLLPDTDVEGARKVAEKICAKLRDEPFQSKGRPFHVTQSVGIAPVIDGDAMGALKVADANLYQAKRAGRNRIVGSNGLGTQMGLA